MHKVHWSIPSFFSLVFLGTFFFSLFIFPFTNYSPAYLEFSQTLSLDNLTNVVQLAGPRGYVEYDIVPHLPSFKASLDLHRCEESPIGFANQPESSVCVWHGLPLPLPPTNLLVVRQGHTPGMATTVWVVYGPGCKGYGIEFQGPLQPRWEGVSRSEEANGQVTETYKVWVPEGVESYTARVSCVWNALTSKDVPAFTEAEVFSPRWARVRGSTQALVTVERLIEIR
jgi:hypothetical protein